ncbi:MAG: hypothetical protein KC619_34120 [Myxococcales bacterium]|nr:hypothetical protein [Myxococcales bacterium]
MGRFPPVLLVFALGTTACIGGEGGPVFIPGSGALPACTEAPSRDVAGHWFDQGTVTVRTAGCDVPIDSAHPACALDWIVETSGNDATIVVDDEYRIEGRACGDQLHLRGGWWLPVEDAIEGCTYDDDSAEEVGIEAEGNVLTIGDGVMTGTLIVRGRCTADYAVVLTRL